MIIKASQRGGARKLALHLLNDNDNEHIEVHEVRGFMSQTVKGAMNEAEAVSRGTKCKQPVFSVSVSPPTAYEEAAARIEDNKMQEIARELFLEHGWNMPDGLKNRENRNPLNFALEEWQQAKRLDCDPKTVKADLLEAWTTTSTRGAFTQIFRAKRLLSGPGRPPGIRCRGLARRSLFPIPLA